MRDKVFTDATMDPARVAFLQKVYSLLTASLGIAAVGAFMSYGMSIALHLPLILLAICLMLAASWNQDNYPLNLGLLFSFVFVDGMALGPAMAYVVGPGNEQVILEALTLTTASFGALTGYVFWSRENFDYLFGFLFAGLISLIAVLLGGAFFGMSSGLYMGLMYFGVLLFIGFILYDTSAIIRRYPTSAYVPATIDLFLDFTRLFWHILNILARRD